MRRRPDAILVAATDAEALQAPLEQAASRGIKVVTFDTTTKDPSFAVTHVSSDIVEAGRKVGTELAQLTGSKGKVMYIDHAPGVGFARQLRSGFEQVIGHKPAMQLLPIQYFDLEPQKANTITRTTITRNPDLAGAFVGVGVGSQGALPALEAAGKLDQVKTVAFDAFNDNIKALRAGRLDAVVSVAAREYGVDTVDAALDALAGKAVPDTDPAQGLRADGRQHRRSRQQALPLLRCTPVAPCPRAARDPQVVRPRRGSRGGRTSTLLRGEVHAVMGGQRRRQVHPAEGRRGRHQARTTERC